MIWRGSTPYRGFDAPEEILVKKLDLTRAERPQTYRHR